MVVDFNETPARIVTEVVGLTIVNAKWLLDRDGAMQSSFVAPRLGE